MIRSIAAICLVLISVQSQAQQQQAGNAASTDTEGTFQALIDACDDVDALMLRARIRLQLPRTTEEAGAKAKTMLEEGFATCGNGDLEGAKSQLSEALEIAEAGVAEKFTLEQAATDRVPDETPATNSTTEDSANESNNKPWWKFW